MKLKLYEILADEIAASIRSGVLQTGDRLPSVRQASTSRGVSPSTVFKAYYLLEARGLIRARDRSGYYVVGKAKSLPPELEPRSLAEESQGRGRCQRSRACRCWTRRSRRDVVPFGSAFPSPLLFPHARLAQVMAATVQRLDPWSVGRRPESRQCQVCGAPSRCATWPTGCRCIPTTSSSPTARWRR